MNCPYEKSIAEAYLCGGLYSPHVIAHLSSCACCTQRISDEAQFDRMLKDGLTAEPVYAQALEARVRNAIGFSTAPMAPALRFAKLRYAFVPVMAFGVILLASIPFIQAQIGKSAICVDAADDHHVEIIEKSPRVWKLDGADVTKLVQAAKLGPGIPARLAPAGYQFAGARICSLHGKRYVHLVYAKGNEQVSVFVRHEPPSWATRASNLFSAQSVDFRTIEGLSIASLQKKDLSLVIVSAAPRNEALALTALAAQQL